MVLNPHQQNASEGCSWYIKRDTVKALVLKIVGFEFIDVHVKYNHILFEGSTTFLCKQPTKREPVIQ